MITLEQCIMHIQLVQSMNENKNVLKYEYEVLKVGDADAILIRHIYRTD